MAFDVIDVLDGLTIDYVLGGSLASSTFGEPRATNDVDIAVALTRDDLAPLTHELRRQDYYVPDSAAVEAVARRSSFNVIHPSGLKIDLFVAGDNPLDQLQMRRRLQVDLPANPKRTIWVTSPADQILRKLDWYRLGGEASDRQWRDIIGLLEAQGQRLNIRALTTDADNVRLGELLERALQAAGVDADDRCGD